MIKRLRGSKGFTLVEIMIVVAIIALLVAIAIPNLLRARLNANESAALGSLRTLVTGTESFRAAQTPPAYPFGLAALGLPTSNPPYVDSRLSTGTKQGYTFLYSRPNVNQYTVTARPVTFGVTGRRIFFVNEEGVIRLNSASGPPIE